MSLRDGGEGANMALSPWDTNPLAIEPSNAVPIFPKMSPKMPSNHPATAHLPKVLLVRLLLPCHGELLKRFVIELDVDFKPISPRVVKLQRGLPYPVHRRLEHEGHPRDRQRVGGDVRGHEGPGAEGRDSHAGHSTTNVPSACHAATWTAPTVFTR